MFLLHKNLISWMLLCSGYAKPPLIFFPCPILWLALDVGNFFFASCYMLNATRSNTKYPNSSCGISRTKNCEKAYKIQVHYLLINPTKERLPIWLKIAIKLQSSVFKYAISRNPPPKYVRIDLWEKIIKQIK